MDSSLKRSSLMRIQARRIRRRVTAKLLLRSSRSIRRNWEQLVAPIALYPDALVAQVLAAWTC